MFNMTLAEDFFLEQRGLIFKIEYIEQFFPRKEPTLVTGLRRIDSIELRCPLKY